MSNEREELTAKVTDEAVRFEKKVVEVQYFKKFTDPCRVTYGIFLNLIKESPKDANRLVWETLGSQPIML